LSDWTLDGLLCAAAGDTATTSVVISTNCFNFAISIRRRRNQHCA